MGFHHVRAPALRAGDTIAVVAPSGTPMECSSPRARRGVAFLEGLGFRVRVMEHASAGRTADRPGAANAMRAADVNAALRDPEVRLVLGAMGGWMSNGMLPLLDTKALERDPKLVQGHSDVTALLVGLHAATGVVTIHGPQLIPHFGRPTGPNPDTLAAWQRLVSDPGAPQDVPWPARHEAELPAWESRADRRGKRDLRPNPLPVVDRPARVEGELLVGNLATLQVLAGTRWWPSFDRAILAWEEVREDYAAIQRSLWHLRETGAFDRLAGMVVGKPLDCRGRPGETFEGIVRDALHGLDFPVAFHHDVGHREPFLALPVGARVRLGEEGRLTLLEPAVASP